MDHHCRILMLVNYNNFIVQIDKFSAGLKTSIKGELQWISFARNDKQNLIKYHKHVKHTKTYRSVL